MWMRSRWILGHPVLFLILAVPAAAQEAEEFLPTPYSAEEIRDAWVEGFEVTTRTRSAEGEIYSRTRVVAWSEEGFGRLEGWLYRVQGDDGITELFFADGLPGPPVLFGRHGEGLDGFVAEQIKREVRDGGEQ